jgi:predicted nucleotidyltransferase
VLEPGPGQVCRGVGEQGLHQADRERRVPGEERRRHHPRLPTLRATSFATTSPQCAPVRGLALSVLGSIARREPTAGSGVDLLYQLRPGARIGWEIDDLAGGLAEIFGRPVDLSSGSRLRKRVVHGYWSVDVEILYTTAAEQLGEFVRPLREGLAVLAENT